MECWRLAHYARAGSSERVAKGGRLPIGARTDHAASSPQWRARTAVMVVCTLASSALVGQGTDRASAKALPPATGYGCGAIALQNLTRLVGQPVSLDRLQQTLGKDTTSFHDIVAAAGTVGVDLTGYRLDFSALAEFGTPAIVRIRGDHFVAVHGFGNDGLEIADGINRSEHVSRAAFERQWDGMALVCRTTAAPSADGPKAFMWSPASVDIGTVVPVGATIRGEIPVANIGNAVLHIEGVRTSCGCLALTPTVTAIEPGATAAIAFELAVSGYVGPRTFPVLITSNDGHVPVRKVAVNVEVRPRLFADQVRVVIRDLFVGSRQTSELRILRPGAPFGLQSVVCDLDAVSVVSEPLHVGDYWGHRLLIQANGEKVGLHRGEIRVLTDSAPSEFAVPIEVHVLGTNAGLLPRVLCVGVLYPGEKVSRVLCLPESAGAVRIKQVQSSAPDVTVKLFGEEPALGVEFAVTAGEEGTPIRALCRVEFAEGAGSCEVEVVGVCLGLTGQVAPGSPRPAGSVPEAQ